MRINLRLRAWLRGFVHNCVIHPILPFLPVPIADWVHDRNADWAFDERKIEHAMEEP